MEAHSWTGAPDRSPFLHVDTLALWTNTYRAPCSPRHAKPGKAGVQQQEMVRKWQPEPIRQIINGVLSSQRG